MKMRLPSFLLAALMVAPLLSNPANARAGRGLSMGSRGSVTWSAPPRTTMTPRWSAPMQRSMTPRAPAPGFTRPMASPVPMSRTSFTARHPFLTGLTGGLLGAGLFGMLSGHGLFGGFHNGFSFIGFLLQIFIVIMLVRFFLRLWHNRPTTSSADRSAGFGMAGRQAIQRQPISLTPEDYRIFQHLLLDVQAAWSTQDMISLQRMTTPEMAGYFHEQLSDLASRGARNIVSNVQFLHGDLAEAWREGNLSYATVALRFSMIDITTDSFGNVIDGSQTEPQTVTELWTFVRTDGRGNWILSAIQQAG